MKKFPGMFVCILLFAGMASAQSKADWKLVWNDEFEREGTPDPEFWSFSGRNSPDWACYCTDSPETTFVKDGTLHLRGIVNEKKTDTVPYQTACIQTKDNFAFKYGRIEVKAKLSKGKGSWPAIWLMPQDSNYGGWPDSGEIDIMEHLNYDGIIYQTIHSNYVTKQNKRKDPVHSATSEFNEGKFNVFALEWYPDRLDFYLNGQKTYTYPKREEEGWEQWPFDQEFYIILDQALGGSWVGEIKDEDLPVEMQVDWVRVYQKSGEF